MGLMQDLLNLVRPPVVPEGEPAPPEPTLADLAEIHARMQVERGDAEALIATAPFRRDELLMQLGTDAAIRRLERDLDAAHLLLERLAKIEPEIQRRIMAKRDDSRAQGWYEMRSRVVDQLRLCEIAMAQHLGAFAELYALKMEAQRAGFVRETDTLPYNASAVVSPAVFANLAGMVAKTPPLHEEDPQRHLYNVRFLGFTQVNTGTPYLTGYLTDQEAGFSATEARRLIEQGLAVLADPKPLPPLPPRKRKRDLTPAEALRIENARPDNQRPTPPRTMPEPLPPEHPRTWTPLTPGAL